jgi:hypothetical protein
MANTLNAFGFWAVGFIDWLDGARTTDEALEWDAILV